MDKANTYRQITQDEAKRMMDELENEIVLDVREQYEYDAGHIYTNIYEFGGINTWPYGLE